MIHSGLLTLEGDPLQGIVWKAKGDLYRLDLSGEKEDLSTLSRILSASNVPQSLGRVPARGPAKPQPDGKTAPSGAPSEASRFEYLESGLVNLGWKAKEAKERIEGAVAHILSVGGNLEEGAILKTAIHLRRLTATASSSA